MAEVLAVAGGISSFAEIAKLFFFATSVLKEAKNAPKEVKGLSEELEILGNIAKRIEDDVQNEHDPDLKRKIDEALRLPLEKCIREVETLRCTLLDLKVDSQQGKMKAWWKNLNVVLEKKKLQNLLEKIERAKSSLQLARQEVSDARAQFRSAAQLDMISTKFDKSFDQGDQVLARTKAIEDRAHEWEIRREQDFQQHFHNIHQVSQTLNAMNSGNITILGQVDQTSDRTMAILNELEGFRQDAIGLESHRRQDSESLKSMEKSVDNMAIALNTLVTKLATSGLQDGQRISSQIQILPEHSDETTAHAVDGSNTKFTAPYKPARRTAKSKRLLSVMRTRNVFSGYINIENTTWHDPAEEEHEVVLMQGSRPIKSRTLVRMKLPGLNRMVYITRMSTRWDPHYETNLRCIRVVPDSSPLWETIFSFDILATRRLFDTGEISPFMETQTGYRLPEFALTALLGSLGTQSMNDNMRNQFLSNARGRAADFLQFLFDASRTEEISVFDAVQAIFLDCGRNSNFVEDVAGILSVCLKYSTDDPLGNDEIVPIPLLVDVDTPRPLVNVCQEAFLPHTMSSRTDGYGMVWENARQMLEDPDGVSLRELLRDARTYQVGAAPLMTPWTAPVRNLCKIASATTRSDIQDVCRNRIEMLLGTPDFHRFIQLEDFNFDQIAKSKGDTPLDLVLDDSLGRQAIRLGWRSWLESLRCEIGETKIDTDGLFDKDMFYSIPKFLSGQISYQTARSTQRAFIINLCSGAFVAPCEEKEKSPTRTRQVLRATASMISYTTRTLRGKSIESEYADYQIHSWEIESIIDAANIAVISKTTPGSWPQEGEINLVPGVDFIIEDSRNDRLHDLILFWYHEATAHGRDEDCDCEEWKAERKRWRRTPWTEEEILDEEHDFGEVYEPDDIRGADEDFYTGSETTIEALRACYHLL